MSSGDLTNKEKIILEERTAFLVNLAGFTIQEYLSAIDTGISTRKLYKILANVIIDWHWLSFKYPDKYKFNGIGELVWIPHKFGALGLVKSKIEYKDIRLDHGLFPNLITLFGSGVYSKYGIRGINPVDNQRYILFPTHIDFMVRDKSRVERQEQHYWEQLVKFYSSLDDTSLDALASCRTEILSSHSLWIQFVLWKRHMNLITSRLGNVNASSLNDFEGELAGYMRVAKACVKQIFLKIDYINDIDRHLEKAQKISANTEFSSLVPCVFESPSDLSGSLEIFIDCSNILAALHKVCKQAWRLVGLDEKQKKPNLIELETSLNFIAAHTTINNNLTNFIHWSSLFVNNADSRKEIAILTGELVEAVFVDFHDKLLVDFEGIEVHYKMFLTNYYPLPKEHFIRGN